MTAQGAGVVLDVTGLTKQFGGLTAVDAVDFRVQERQICSLIGPNGAGKTTFFNMVAGQYEPTSGDVIFDGRSLRGLRPHQITARGIGRTFQNIRLFGLMTAEENVMVAMHSHMRAGIISTLIKTRAQRREEAEAHARARELLDFVGIRRGSAMSSKTAVGEYLSLLKIRTARDRTSPSRAREAIVPGAKYGPIAAST